MCYKFKNVGVSMPQYCINIKKTSEKLVRDYLLRNSDTVRFTKSPEGQLVGFFRYEKFADSPRFTETLKKLEKYFIKTMRNNERFNEIPQGKNDLYEHYFYRLEPGLKKLINKETIFYYTIPPSSENFYALEDPTYYKKGKMLGSVTGHEPCVFLYITEKEKRKLEKSGFIFYS